MMEHKLKLNPISFFYILAILFALIGVDTGFLLMEVPFPFYQMAFVCLFVWYALVLRLYFSRISNIKRVIFSFVVLIFVVLFVFCYIKEMPITLMILMGSCALMHGTILRPVKKGEAEAGLWMLVVAGIIFVYAFYTYKTSWWGVSITIGEFNPQAVGGWAMLFSLAFLLAMDEIKYWKHCRWFGIICFGMYFQMMWIMGQTEMRTGQVIWILMTILHILPMCKILYNRYILKAGVWSPALVVMLSVLLYLLGFHDSQGNTLLDGREILWLKYLNDAISLPLTGRYLIDGSAYSHNIMVDYIYMFGFVIAFFFFILMESTLRTIVRRKKRSHRINYDACCAFLCCVLLSSMEGMVFSTGAGGVFIIAFYFMRMVEYND